MKKITYQLMWINDNEDEDYLIGIELGCDIYDYIRKKYSKIIDPDMGKIEISGYTDNIPGYIVLDNDFEKPLDYSGE